MKPLARLRLLERLLRLHWGVTRVVAVAVVLLMLCCAVDWVVDRWLETPRWLHWALFLAQLGAALAVVLMWLGFPLLGRLSDARLALWAEAAWPNFRHRLISAVELNRPGADTTGMSPRLIAEVTREAEAEAARAEFAKALDKRRLLWGAGVVLPVLLVALGLFLLYPETVRALLARQLFGDAEIPRSVALRVEQAELVWPSGDPIDLRLIASGPGVQPGLTGKLRLKPDGLPPEEFVLERLEDGPQPGETVYVARIPPATVSFHYEAWLADGRLPHPARVTFEPRPAVRDQKAYVVLPEFCGLKPSGGRYEEEQPKGDVVGFLGSDVLLAVAFNKPVVQATLELLGPGDEGGQDQVKRRLPLTLSDEGRQGGARFDLRPEETSYRIALVDAHGFNNRVLPRRTLAIKKDTPPQVKLLREVFRPDGASGPLDDFTMDGVPVAFGPKAQIRVGYYAWTDTALDRAWVRYRVFRGTEEIRELDAEPPERAGLWRAWPYRGKPAEPPRRGEPVLTEWTASDTSGPFKVEEGVFERTLFKQAIGFHAVASPDPERYPGRREGGGRVDVPLVELKYTDASGADFPVEVGDRVAFYVEVSDKRSPALVGRSEMRVKDVVTYAKYAEWLKQKQAVSDRIKEIEARQEGQFPGTPDPK